MRPDAWEIETFLMSCRVLRRGVEGAILQCIADDAVAAGATTLRGEYRPTPKNAQVATFYPDHGFRTTGEGRFEAACRWPWSRTTSRFTAMLDGDPFLYFSDLLVLWWSSHPSTSCCRGCGRASSCSG